MTKPNYEIYSNIPDPAEGYRPANIVWICDLMILRTEFLGADGDGQVDSQEAHGAQRHASAKSLNI